MYVFFFSVSQGGVGWNGIESYCDMGPSDSESAQLLGLQKCTYLISLVTITIFLIIVFYCCLGFTMYILSELFSHLPKLNYNHII